MKDKDNSEKCEKPIAKCLTCGKQFYNNEEFICVRWSPNFIGSYCNNNKCSGEDCEDDDV